MSDTLDPPWTASTTLAGPDAPSLAQRAEAALQAGRTGLARSLIAALRRLDPHGFPGLEAQLMLREGKAVDAVALLTPLIDTQATTALLLLRAEARMGLDDAPGAAMDAADAVLLDRHDPVAKAMLGTILVSLGRFEDAASCLNDALASAPAQPSFRLALSAAQEGMGLAAEALATLDEGRRLHPRSTALHNAAALLHMRLGQPLTAIEIASATQAMGIADACTLGLLGHSLSLLGRHEAAGPAYRDALALAPEDAYVRHLVAAAGLGTVGARAPADYVRTLFDGYAPQFESHLLSLGYRVPGLFAAIVREDPAPPGPVLDLGCGTGFVALTCQEFVDGPWTGIDLSPAMLEAARSKGLYATLIEADVMEALAEGGPDVPLMLAADLLCYFGDLHAPLAAAARRLAPGGRLLLTTEGQEDGDTCLTVTGRWTHGGASLRDAAAAAGLIVRRLTPEILRWEDNKPVHGLLADLVRP